MPKKRTLRISGDPSISHRSTGDSVNYGWKITVLRFHCIFPSFSQPCFTKNFFLFPFDNSVSFRCQPLLKHWTMALTALTYTALPIVLLLLSIHLNTLFFIHLWSPVVLVPLSANGTEEKDAGNRLLSYL